jgi:hypothetical protein
MKVYNKEKTKILEEYDLIRGYIKEDTIEVHYPEVKGVEEKGHYETIREYPNGGKDVEWVIDVAGVEYKPDRYEEEQIYVYITYEGEEKKEMLRNIREIECFSIINRGKLWYDTLTPEQISELNEWYRAWLEVTETLVEPKKPEWIK